MVKPYVWLNSLFEKVILEKCLERCVLKELSTYVLRTTEEVKVQCNPDNSQWYIANIVSFHSSINLHIFRVKILVGRKIFRTIFCSWKNQKLQMLQNLCCWWTDLKDHTQNIRIRSVVILLSPLVMVNRLHNLL